VNDALEPLASFVLPRGNEVAARLHFARTVCRRAERRIVELADQTSINPTIATYLNRLSARMNSSAWAVDLNAPCRLG
jgi:cob(I)alamin adenosyltransferase